LNSPSGNSVESATSLIAGQPKYTRGVHEEERKKVFISYSSSEENKKDNEYLAEEIVRPVLEMLNFEVLSYNRNRSQRVKPMDWIEANVKTCHVLVAFLTRDLKISKEGEEEWHPKPNISNEIGMVRDECLVVPFAEIGVIIPSNVEEKYHCPPFEREKYGELLVELLKILKKEKMY
jgi:hypothetical protein